MIERDAVRIRHIVLDDSLGCSMHVPTRDDVQIANFSDVLERFERGSIPTSQREVWDFALNEWTKSQP